MIGIFLESFIFENMYSKVDFLSVTSMTLGGNSGQKLGQL